MPEESPLSLAINAGHRPIIDFLIENGVLNLIDESWLKGHYLACAARKNDHITLAMLLGKGLGTDCPDREAFTALHWAAMEGSIETVQLLIDAGAGLDVPDKWGRTPLLHASAMGRTDIAHAEHRDNEGRTA